MAGTSSRGAVTEDWLLATPSPRTLISGFWNDDFSSGPFNDAFVDNGSNKPQDGIDKSRNFSDSSREEDGQVAKAPLQVEKPSSNDSLPEKIGARNGFCSLKIDTSRVGSSASIRSLITIPPGVSPRELLESPVFVPNAIAQPSPTTGKLPFFMRSNATPAMTADRVTLRSKPPSFSTADRGSSAVHQNQASADNNQQELSLKSSSTATKDVTDATFAKPKTSDSMFDSDHRIATDEQESETNQDGDYSSDPIISDDKDGYNWRKYGQRQVKNSEHPRTYYKCTHQNCPVKKKVERSQDGHITEIVYKGSHNHPLPPPNRRPSVPFSHFNDLQADGPEKFDSMPGLDAETSPENIQDGHFQDMHGEVLETRLPPSLNKAELAVTSFTETREAVNASLKLSSEEDTNKGTHGATCLGCDGDEDESESKRRFRKMGSVTPAATHPMSTMEIEAMTSRAFREPRVVVQTTSEVDILDDGYRWRKYGQKVVKGNPNPRSYYKCTHPCCSVRKHVERASNDLRSVITTYEGKHNHEVPAARNSGQPSSGTAAAPQGLHRRPELPAQGSLAQFRGASAYGSQLAGAAGGFFLGMLPHGVAVPVPSLGTTAMPIQIQMAGHPPAMQRYPGLVLPVGEVKVNPVAPPGLPVANGTAYEQLMGRLSQGHQMQ